MGAASDSTTLPAQQAPGCRTPAEVFYGERSPECSVNCEEVFNEPER